MQALSLGPLAVVCLSLWGRERERGWEKREERKREGRGGKRGKRGEGKRGEIGEREGGEGGGRGEESSAYVPQI